MEQGSEPLLFHGDTHPPLSFLRVPAALKPHAKTLLLSWSRVLPKPSTKCCCSEISTGTREPPRFLSGAKCSPGEGGRNASRPPLTVSRTPSPPATAPCCPGMLWGGGAGPKARSSSSPAAAGFCKTRVLRGSRAAGRLSCASPGGRTGCPLRGRVLSGWLSENSASGKPCGRTCGRRRCGR